MTINHHTKEHKAQNIKWKIYIRSCCKVSIFTLPHISHASLSQWQLHAGSSMTFPLEELTEYFFYSFYLDSLPIQFITILIYCPRVFDRKNFIEWKPFNIHWKIDEYIKSPNVLFFVLPCNNAFLRCIYLSTIHDYYSRKYIRKNVWKITNISSYILLI